LWNRGVERGLRIRYRALRALRRALASNRESIEEPELIERILVHRRERGGEEAMTVSLAARGPPQASLL